MTKEQQKLIADNYGFYIYYFNLHHIYDEDRRQRMLLQLCAYIDNYNPERGEFTTFASIVFESRLKKDFEEAQRDIRKANSIAMSLDMLLSEDDEDSNKHEAEALLFEDYGYDSAEAKIIFEQAKKIAKSSVSSTAYNHYLSYLRTGSYKMSGKLFGVSGERIRQNVKKVQQILKEKMKYED